MTDRSMAESHDALTELERPGVTVEVAVQGAVLVCHQTPTGSWLCCTDDGAPSCARGFSLASAAARWEAAQVFAE